MPPTQLIEPQDSIENCIDALQKKQIQLQSKKFVDPTALKKNEEEIHDLDIIIFCIKHRHEGNFPNKDDWEDTARINSTLAYTIHKKNKTYTITVDKNLSLNLSDEKNIDVENFQLKKENPNLILKELEATKTTLDKCLFEQQYNENYDTIIDDEIDRLSEKHSTLLEQLKNERPLKDTLFFGPLNLSKKAILFKKFILDLFHNNPTVNISITDDKPEIVWIFENKQINVLELISDVIQESGFYQLNFDFKPSEILQIQTKINGWLKTSEFENEHTTQTLEIHRKKLECLTLYKEEVNAPSILEQFALAMHTKFTPTANKSFPLCTIINRAVLAQDEKNLFKLATLFKECNDDENKKYSRMAFLITDAALLVSGLGKLIKFQKIPDILYRDTFLDKTTLEMLMNGLENEKPVALQQCFSSSKEDQATMTPTQLKNGVGDRATLILHNFWGGDLEKLAYEPYAWEKEVLILPSKFIVIAHESYDENGKTEHVFFSRHSWGIETTEEAEKLEKEKLEKEKLEKEKLEEEKQLITDFKNEYKNLFENSIWKFTFFCIPIDLRVQRPELSGGKLENITLEQIKTLSKKNGSRTHQAYNETLKKNK